MLELEIIALDVLSDGMGGYTVNDAIHTGRFIELPEDYTKEDIIRECFDRYVDITIEDDGFTSIFVDREEDGKPLLELKYCY